MKFEIIRVEFLNAFDDSLLGVSEMRAEQLPDSFAVHTTLGYDDSKWSVVSANPSEKEAFVQSGTLQLFLSPIGQISPEKIGFTLPTLSDDVGALVGDELSGPDIYSIHEDDWRQTEFVSDDLLNDIELELADIRLIYQNERESIGFNKLHIRKRLPHALVNRRMTICDIEPLFRPVGKFKAVGFLKTRGVVAGSFAWQLDQRAVLWGVVADYGEINCLCLAGNPQPESIPSISKAFAALNSATRLVFMDWCRAISISDDASAFSEYFFAIESRIGHR